MAMIQIRINTAVLAAVVVCELISYFWYSEVVFRRYEERYLIPALCADLGLSILIQSIISTHWSVRKLEDAVALGICAAALYASLIAPHAVTGPSSAITLAVNSLHKLVIVSAMTMTQYYVRKSGY